MTVANSNSITGITTITASTDVANKEYVDSKSGGSSSTPSQTGNAGEFLTTTDGVTLSWDYVSNYEEFTTTGAQTFTVPSYSNVLLIEAVGAGGGGSAGTSGGSSGAGGGSGSYTSWYVPKAIVSSNITVNPGVGGAGGSSSGATGSAGAGTTVSWTGPGGTYTITASGGGAAGVAGTAQAVSQSSFYYTTAGLIGGTSSSGVGNTATTQTNQFQPTGGGSGAGTASQIGGAGGTINVYGISTSASGGTTSSINGVVGFAYTGLPYGSGGGGGGTGASTAGNGGNGTRGGGGGGGASNTAAFGNGGNGGDGYVKITWW
jgi:hypothetical protein